jgi:hypothetical protein
MKQTITLTLAAMNCPQSCPYRSSKCVSVSGWAASLVPNATITMSGWSVSMIGRTYGSRSPTRAPTTERSISGTCGTFAQVSSRSSSLR